MLTGSWAGHRNGSIAAATINTPRFENNVFILLMFKFILFILF